jgi:ATP-binding cassette subfamily F protein 3
MAQRLWKNLKSVCEIFGMKAEIDEINEQLTIRTDYESDAYMKLIERVST